MTDEAILALFKTKYGKVKKANNNWFYIPCPSCLPKNARKLKRGVNLVEMRSKCFICGEKLSIKDLIGKDIKRTDGPIHIPDEPEHPQAREIPSNGVIPINELPSDHPAVEFFKKDHLNDLDRYWKENFIGFITKESAIDIVYKHEDRPWTKISPANSLIFPVYYKGDMVGWQLRWIPGTPRYRYLHIFKKGDHLYNFDNAINYKTVVVVEGVKKALKFENAVCTFGKSISETQIQKLQNWKQIVFMYDGEDATQEETKKLVKQINIGSRKCINIDPRIYGFDSPDEMPEETAQKIVYLEWQKANNNE